MNAKEARLISEKNAEAAANRQMTDIILKIKKATVEGDFSVNLGETIIYENNLKKLNEDGYAVVFGYKASITGKFPVRISW